MFNELKIWIKAVTIYLAILLIIYMTFFTASYAINRGWNLGQYHSDKMAIDRVYELLTLGAD